MTKKNIFTTLVILLTLSAIYLLSQDFLALLHLKNTSHILQKTQITKENQLTKQLEKKSPQLLLKQLNLSETLITFSQLCESSHLLVKKLQIKKLNAKTEDLMEISLKSCGNYAAIINFLSQLNSLPYLTDFKAFKISRTRLQNSLEVSIELLLSTSYLSTAPVILRSAFCDEGSPYHKELLQSVAPQDDKHKKNAIQNDIASPFLMNRITGKIEIPAHIDGNKLIPTQSIRLLFTEDEISGACILQKKLEYSPSI